jgi:uncharacterized protein
MPRPKISRRLRFRPDVYYFKPQGAPLRELKEVILNPDELESLKLYGVEGHDQAASASRMKVSQPTFARILKSAHKKIADAIISGKAIRISKLP